MDNSVPLRWIDVDRAVGDMLLAEALGGQDATFHAQDRALARLGITRAEGERPLAAWLRARAEGNGLPVTFPAVPARGRAIESTPGVMQFVFWLA